MEKLNKNFREQRNTVEAMTGICADGKCVCNYDPCDCAAFQRDYYSLFKSLYNSTKNAFAINVKA